MAKFNLKQLKDKKSIIKAKQIRAKKQASMVLPSSNTKNKKGKGCGCGGRKKNV